MENLEQRIQGCYSENLQRVYKLYGNDPEKWGWLVDATFKCRAPRGEGFKLMELKAELGLGKKKCPMKGREVSSVRVPHPADNVAGAIIASKYPKACPLCGLKPTEYDFDIR
ncbi:hypothetical protein A3A76_05145 [Candidatus Woesebacteria bacterium RIFCSPLOWO2_01_FULL_39_23]|uniref:Transposase n=2 Tax=Microgenomates group TaxID=1794810 RepID=A0A0H4T6H2_9BACT|nr:hypothetical protein [uncultured Microgenomates bacterium Rifle_16ft_4_minimus_37633]OGM13868.1 MAG: hypothetical protein A2141_04370 [Candidatus Woesebacteria bacterium RBG_16_40_11]OGM27820.1 MAG: hypothetical protein A2628_05365 [Candidatus Woesebacteria bacterium RIFCSPHIGHO2_01_FULL_40_22]OGM36070.1 MAG: hypothetical protein A3E41_04530 [Candidatus Woesebacteria bacterium RIFCSPHIGHO2_12_FULL_38_9]OGM62242.1 MAG: hypothetical protein A3A76_05145 [Candidatus Woesebacteria bacterium RIFCS